MNVGERTKGVPKARLNATLYAMALEELAQGPTTRLELEQHTGLGRCTILSLVTALHRRRLIYIAGWERDSRGGPTIAAFELGSKKDARKPPPVSSVQCKRNHRERMRQAVVLQATASQISA